MRAFRERFHSNGQRVMFLDDVNQSFSFYFSLDTPLYSIRKSNEQIPNVQLHTARISHICVYLLNVIVNYFLFCQLNQFYRSETLYRRSGLVSYCCYLILCFCKYSNNNSNKR